MAAREERPADAQRLRHERDWGSERYERERSERSDRRSRYEEPTRHGDDRYERRSRHRDERDEERRRRRDRDEDHHRSRHDYERRSHRTRDETHDDAHSARAARRSRSPDARPPGPNLERSGLLAKESNSVNGVALKYHEPPEAKRPRTSWRMFVFKDSKEVDMLVLGRQSCYLLGRDRTVVDIPIEHPSCSKQHAVIQFRQVVKRNEFGDEHRYVQPFLIDLDSANGCTVNNEEIPASRYYELRSGDTCQFGASSREYVLLDEAAAPS